MHTKTCTACQEDKPATLEHFRKSPLGKLGLHSQCRKCQSELAKQRRAANPAEANRRAKEYRDQYKQRLKVIPESKQCTKCGQTFPATKQHFSTNNAAPDGMSLDCKSCKKLTTQHYRAGLRAKEHAYSVDILKTCSHCEESKPATLEYFWKNQLAADGLFYLCIDCGRNHCREYEAANRERFRDRKTIRRKILAALPKVIPESKPCGGCREVKPSTEFHKNCNRRDGLDFYCKACDTQQWKQLPEDVRASKLSLLREWGLANPEKRRIARRQHYLINKEKVAEQTGAYRQSHRAIQGEQRRQRYASNPERFRAKRKSFYAFHIDRLRQEARQYWWEHRNEISQRTKRRYAANPERFREWGKAGSARRRARKRNVKSTLTSSQIEQRWHSQNGICFWCHQPIEREASHLDHIVPLSKGGSHTYRNVRFACRTCNLRKSAAMPRDFLTLLKREGIR